MTRPRAFRDALVRMLAAYDNAASGYERAMRRGDRRAADDHLSHVIEIEGRIARLTEGACG